MASLFVQPWRPLLEQGVVAPGGKVWFTQAGTDIPQAVYSDDLLNTLRTNPVIADANGRVPATYLDDELSYRVRIYGRNATVGQDSPLEEYDPYVPGAFADAPPGGSGGDPKVLTPAQFGAVEWNGSSNLSTSEDASDALQAMFDFWTNNAGYTMGWNGTYVIRSPLTIGRADANALSRSISGFLKLYADAPMDVMVTMIRFGEVECNAKLEVTGSWNVDYASRQVGTGVLLYSCVFNKLPDIYAEGFKYYGLNTLANHGSPDNLITRFRGTFCGSGLENATYSLQSTWNTPVSNSDPADQLTTINVGTMFPADFVTVHNDGNLLDSQVLVRISGQYYIVKAYNAGAGTISVHPWLDPAAIAAGSGTLTYVLGASDRWWGPNSDVNVIVSQIAQFCGRGHTQQGLYGNTVENIQASNNGIAMSLANGNGNLLWAFDIGQYYEEGNDCSLMVQGTLTRGLIRAAMELDWDKIKYFPSPRADSATTGDRYIFQNFNEVTIGYRGYFHSYEKERRGKLGASDIAMSFERPFQFITFNNVNSALTWSIPAPSEYAQAKNDFYGYDSFGLILMGNWTDGAPNGTQHFYPPSTYTVNGGAGPVDLVPDGSGPIQMVAVLDYTTKDITIRALTGV